jgi:hypothetical protein
MAVHRHIIRSNLHIPSDSQNFRLVRNGLEGCLKFSPELQNMRIVASHSIQFNFALLLYVREHIEKIPFRLFGPTTRSNSCDISSQSVHLVRKFSEKENLAPELVAER